MSECFPVLEARGVAHAYRSSGADRAAGLQVVDPIELRIEHGDFVSIVGPSGCGKTTLLRILAGLLRPSDGVVLDRGVPVAGPDWRRSLVFQHPQLFPWLTVEQNVSFGPRNRGIRRREYQPKVEELIRLVRLEEFKAAYPHQLSGGMKQRASLARSLANEPHILLLDEPLGALDALTREHMQDEIRAIWRRTECTVVLVTHSVEEALYLSTRVIVLSDRPARVVAEFPVRFSREEPAANGKNGKNGRTVKSGREFLAMREEVLGYIWQS